MRQITHLFQRLVPNEFGWVYPSPGRLRDPDSEDVYLDFTGFGHEDWNFNKDFAVNNWLYGYLYYEPANPTDTYNIAFASYEPGDSWYLAGFYLNAEFVASGSPISTKVLSLKARHLRLLEAADSLGNEYGGLTDAKLLAKLRNDARLYKWRVRPKNVIVLQTPLPISATVFAPRAHRYRRPENITTSEFGALRQLALPKQHSSRKQAPLDDQDYFEGDEYETTHKKKERSRDLVKAAKARFIRMHGRLFCEVCSFDFEKKYGVTGRNFIEAHHTVPIGKLKVRTAVKIEELAMLCSNCHRMMHRKQERLLKLKQLKALLRPS
jgi:hypothetical protein